MISSDLRHAFRLMAAAPAFAAVAILSLALGIGANTAIFSLWNSVVHAALPAVRDPGGLVMLSNPAASGSWRGRWNTTADGPRSWISYAEFEQLRDHASTFSGVMASQSGLNTWQTRIDGGGTEETRGRMVSGGFFDVLGVRPAVGRLFTTAEDAGEPSYAVISHAYWQRRFGGNPDVVGRSLTIGDTAVTIVGVTPPNFVGETSGQRPDFWLPLRLQPRVVRGANWLQETPPDKVMWLHLFGRLKPGVTPAQAEAQANAIFQAGLESFYGPIDGDRRREFLDQHLRVFPGARGVSSTLDQFSASLTVLLASVGILLMIACANLANLLLARSVARRGEMTVRVSLGATPARLVRQVVTESLALAAVGGVAALALAFPLHSVLVQMLQQADPWFVVQFGVDVRILAFAVAATLAAALLVGAIPAVQIARSDAATHLKDHSRGTIGSGRELRSGRWLVAVQLALSLPLLVGAGLLARTAYNLQHPDLGFRSGRLLMARVNLGEAAPDVARRDRILRELQARMQRVPGVDAVSFSQLGLFSGGVSTSGIVVEGSALTRERAVFATLDRVGAGYFTTMGIPVRAGRDVSEADRAGSPTVCLVNEAFVQRFFGGRQPLGRQVITVDDDNRTAYEVVGVVADARMQTLRGAVEPRFFVPAEQRNSQASSRTFLIRTTAEPVAVTAAIRDTVTAVDPALSVTGIRSMDEHLAELTAEEHAVAQLAVVFGTVALALAAIGLYGVLSYGVARRAREIAIRIALGAQRRGVIAMILRESVGLVIAGLTSGGALAYYGTALLATRLYGVAPGDPLTVIAAIGVLLLVAFAAAYLPARRASRVNPMAALHQA